MAAETINLAQPHFVPGYTGFCPQFKYRVGDTYGHTTHKLLLDPSVSHSEKLVLSDRTVDDYQVFRPPPRDVDIVDARFRYNDAIYKHPLVPGYEGFVPREHGRFGQRFTVQATEGLASFERKQQEERESNNQLIKLGALQDGRWEPAPIEDKALVKSQFKLPLVEVRPEMAGILRTIPVPEPPFPPPTHGQSPFFMESSNPDKYIKTGYSGHVPFANSTFGKTNAEMTNSALCDFVSNYRKRQSTEWAPVSIVRPDPPLQIQPTEIYYKHLGQIPNYGGHIPGAMFRHGKTFGNDSRDAKRWLRGDFSV
ncbi:UPF0605 protein CG18335-like [Chrysoperla carnea]|uniref:UPF0605 protein CG18335-like n=1 Tax=Chrysoperla carnea TaxID=189513 RepID=UPI001D08C077|nr:UPF0605 protein CG18335-like [Chrysoperla carnea]